MSQKYKRKDSNGLESPTTIYICVTHARGSLTINGTYPHLIFEWRGSGRFQHFAIAGMILQLRSMLLSLRSQWGPISENISARAEETSRQHEIMVYRWKQSATGGAGRLTSEKERENESYAQLEWLNGSGESSQP